MESYSKIKYIAGIFGVLIAVFLVGYLVYTYNLAF